MAWKKLLWLMPLLILVFSCANSAPGKINTGIPFNDVFYNPVVSDGADVFVTYHDGFYYYVSTNGLYFYIGQSKTLSALMSSADNTKIIWTGMANAIYSLRAPEIYFIDGFWYAYIGAVDPYERAASGGEFRFRMFVLKSRSDDPMGEWDLIGRLFLPVERYAYHGTLLKYKGQLFFIWSGINDYAKDIKRLYICELSEPDKIKAGTKAVMISEPQYHWEKMPAQSNEAPSILYQPDGGIKCVYSASSNQDDTYCLGQLTLTGNPMEPESWIKSPKPILEKYPFNGVYGIGHSSFTASPDGQDIWMVYHTAKRRGSSDSDRCIQIQKVNFDSQGNLDLTPPPGTNNFYQIPSGEKPNRLLFEMENGLLANAEIEYHEAAHGEKAVRLDYSKSELEMDIDDITEGNYILYLRYKCPFNISELKIKLNGQVNYALPLKNFGDCFGIAGGLPLLLNEGKNSLVFSADNLELTYEGNIILDALILEKK